VQPDVVRLTLSDGDYIDVKKELNAGEERRVWWRLVKTMTPGEKPVLDPEKVGLTKVVEYLVGWSFTDTAGKPVKVSEAALTNLDGETYSEIVKVIDAHDDAVIAEREARKNGKGDTANSSTTSLSVA